MTTMRISASKFVADQLTTHFQKRQCEHNIHLSSPLSTRVKTIPHSYLDHDNLPLLLSVFPLLPFFVLFLLLLHLSVLLPALFTLVVTVYQHTVGSTEQTE